MSKEKLRKILDLFETQDGGKVNQYDSFNLLYRKDGNVSIQLTIKWVNGNAVKTKPLVLQERVAEQIKDELRKHQEIGANDLDDLLQNGTNKPNIQAGNF